MHQLKETLSYLEYLALSVADGGVFAWLVHSQGNAVDQDDGHGHALEAWVEKDPGDELDWTGWRSHEMTIRNNEQARR